MKAATAEEVLEAIQQVVGPDFVLLSTTFFAKYPLQTEGANQPKCLTVIGTHQDRQYWGLEPASAPVASVWIAIDNATRENGAMQMYPTTHKTPLPHVKHYDNCSALFDAQSIPPEDLPAESEFLELVPGQYAIFDSRTAHRSGRNSSPSRRIGLTMIYASADIVLKEMDYQNYVEWRVPMPIRCAGKSCEEPSGAEL
ncbi:PHYH [Symbiodinium natans]|uniref:PHYH protein n=1 Tax=Symbiodinium natans TaxID=878477 RepID=A0A812R8A2_9DINO|nr:PHYH [Symbiodinium natans]